MTNFEINMRNQVQKQNKVRVENALRSIDVGFETVRTDGYIFISIFPILDEEIAIAPSGVIETTVTAIIFQNTDEVIEWVEENRSY